MVSLNPDYSLKHDLDDSGCVQDASVGENGCKDYAQLLDLSDDVLLYILRYLTPRDLKALGHTCPRLGSLICDRTLWTRVDARTSPVGQQRMRWLLKHCLSPATTELKIAGYANKYSRCLGIQDLPGPGPIEVDQDLLQGGCVGSQEGVDVEHFLLRMWYPHLPRFAVSPRWPDQAEVDSKNEKSKADNEKAAEVATYNFGEASSSSASSAPSSSSSGQNSSSGYESGKFDKYPAVSSKYSGKSDQNAVRSSENSSKSDQNSSNSGENPSNSSQNPNNSEPKKTSISECPFPFDIVKEVCKGPQFTLNTHLMKALRKTCSHLSSLALEYCNLDYKTTNLSHFPLHLKKLSLRGTRCYNLPFNNSYLGKVQERLPELEYLDVSECDWFEPASLMPLSKLVALTELYMRDCKRLTECVAYASLATRYGFRKLRVLDARGSPLADSEVSALGWLPRLEELYVAPPQDFATVKEHTHSWADIDTVFTELDSWEVEEPDYYKIKSEETEQEEDVKDDEPENERQGDVLINNPWWTHERRIIVIQPNASRQELEQRYPPPRQRQPRIEDEDISPAQPGQGPTGRPGPVDPQPGPASPQPGPTNSQPGLENPKPDPANQQTGPANQQTGLTNPQPGPANPKPGPTNSQPGPTNSQPGPTNSQPGPANSQPCPGNPRPCPAYPRVCPLQLGSIDIVPINPPRPMQHQPVLLAPRPGPVNPRPVPSDPRGVSSQFRVGPIDAASPRPGPSNPQRVDPMDINLKRRLIVAAAVDQAKRRRLKQTGSVAGEDMRVNLPTYLFNLPSHNPELCPRNRPVNVAVPENVPERQPDFVRLRRRGVRDLVHIDVDINRHSSIHIGSHLGYHLVSDSALLRFGRAENENVNYVHIGRNGVHHGSETGSRPDRSNLRILSVTGYRNITDRSLEHLVTAAPYLLHIDFSETNVTARGVELFKAVRPDCDVIFSDFDRMT